MSSRNTRSRAATQQNHSSHSNSGATTDELAKQLKECKKQQKDLSSSQQFISSQFDDFVNQLQELTDSNKEMRKELNSVVNKCRQQADEIEQLKTKLNSCEQKDINNNAIIRGISSNDDARESVKKVAALAGVNIEDHDISSARHMQPTNKPSAIVVSFNKNEKKIEFVKSAKQKRISSAQIGYSGDAYPIYVDHQLTTESFNLFLEAKKLKKLGVTFVWIANGNILLREKVGKPAIKITSISQLKSIEKEFLLQTKKTNTNTQQRESQRTANPTSNINTANNERANNNKKLKGKQRSNNVTPPNGSMHSGASTSTNTIASLLNVNQNGIRNRSVLLVNNSDTGSASDSDYVDP